MRANPVHCGVPQPRRICRRHRVGQPPAKNMHPFLRRLCCTLRRSVTCWCGPPAAALWRVADVRLGFPRAVCRGVCQLKTKRWAAPAVRNTRWPRSSTLLSRSAVTRTHTHIHTRTPPPKLTAVPCSFDGTGCRYPAVPVQRLVRGQLCSGLRVVVSCFCSFCPRLRCLASCSTCVAVFAASCCRRLTFGL